MTTAKTNKAHSDKHKRPETPNLDYSTLKEKYTLKEFLAVVKDTLLGYSTMTYYYIAIAVFLFIYILIPYLLANSYTEILSDMQANSILALVLFVLIVWSVVGLIHLIYNELLRRVKQKRIEIFANRNNLELQLSSSAEGMTGLVFSWISIITLVNKLYLNPDNTIEVGNLMFLDGSKKTGGYIKIKLPKNVPNLLLDSKSNNLVGGISNFETTINQNQRISLEGDFDKYYQLYAPQTYEGDALYILTPDVMDLLIQRASGYDIEFIDDSIVLYSTKPFDLSNRNELQEIVELSYKIQTEFHRQTKRYNESRLEQASPAGVNGKRLKTSNVITFGLVILLVGLIIASEMIDPNNYNLIIVACMYVILFAVIYLQKNLR